MPTSARAQRSAVVPAEERRLNTAVFREGLKKRGLREVLDLHLKDFPPQSGAEQLLLEREPGVHAHLETHDAVRYLGALDSPSDAGEPRLECTRPWNASRSIAADEFSSA